MRAVEMDFLHGSMDGGLGGSHILARAVTRAA